jgi:transposase-like protein
MEAWIARVRREQIDPDDTMSEAQRREVLRLQRENAALQREVEFLKKAGAFFRDRDHGPKGMR